MNNQMTMKAKDLRYLAKHRKCVTAKFPTIKHLNPEMDPYQYGCKLQYYCATHCQSFTECDLIQQFYIFSGQHHAGNKNTFALEEG